ncbi:MAG: MraY family glycosyltransferase [Cyanobacteriota bacterium]|nr:MraY family glycosyltransferase [Cyanobacteriota bacterium]
MPIEQGSLTLALITAGAAFLVAIMAVPLLTRFAPSLGLLDRPGGHKLHEGEVPVVGGVAIFIAAAFGALYLGPPMPPTHWAFVAACLMLLGVGVIDDVKHVSPRSRLALQAVVVTLCYLGLGFKVDSLGNLFGTGMIDLGAFALPFAILATVALINAFNMLDGLDGLAGGVALVALLALCAWSLHDQRPLLAAVSAASIGGVLGFLMFNLPLPMRGDRLVFMGDGGSTLLGFVIAALCIGLQVEQSPQLSFYDIRGTVHPAELLWLVAIPVFEIVTTTLRRMMARMSPMQPDNGHYHHRLRQAGWSVRAIFLLYLLFSVASMLVGLSLHRLGMQDPVAFWGFLGLYALWHAGMVAAERRGLSRLAAASAAGAHAEVSSG